MYSIWDAAGQRIDTVAFPDPLVPQEVGETVRQFVKPTVRVLLDDAILAKPTQGQMAGTRAACVAGYCFVCDIQAPIVRKPTQFASRLFPFSARLPTHEGGHTQARVLQAIGHRTVVVDAEKMLRFQCPATDPSEINFLCLL